MTAERWGIQTCWPPWSFLLTLTLSLKREGTPDTQVSNPCPYPRGRGGPLTPTRRVSSRTEQTSACPPIEPTARVERPVPPAR